MLSRLGLSAKPRCSNPIDSHFAKRLLSRMSDSVSVTTNRSWFSRIGGAIAGVLFGLILFLAAFPLLTWNEGRAIKRAKTLQLGSKAVVAISSDAVDAANEGRLVHLNGDVAVEGDVTDPVFGVTAPVIKLRRNVEMYQWVEEKKDETRKKLGGGEETVTTYSYSKKWSSDAIDSTGFQKQEGHENPSGMAVEAETFVGEDPTIGAFKLPPDLVGLISNFRPLPIAKNAEVPSSAADEPVQIFDEGFYVGKSPKTPAVGDLKIRFEAVDPGPFSVVARQIKNTFEPYVIENLGSIELLEPGTVSAATMFANEQQGNVIVTWILRLVGFVMMFFGLLLLAQPLVVVADVIPFLGNLLGAGVGLFALVIALPLTLITVALAWLAYRPLIGIPLLLAAAASIYFGIRATRRKKLTPPPLTAG
ncbi:MAG: TMEM43 family protein [Terrimicrobiaceae bacterium]